MPSDSSTAPHIYITNHHHSHARFAPYRITPDAGLVHVFSHVRHFMAVAFQTTDVPLGKGDDIDAPPVVGNVPKGLELPSHTAYRWISKEEMRDLGVTSAITKVLKLLDSSEKKKRKKKKVVKKDKGKGEEKEKPRRRLDQGGWRGGQDRRRDDAPRREPRSSSVMKKFEPISFASAVPASRIVTRFGPARQMFFAISTPTPPIPTIRTRICVSFAIVSSPNAPICRLYRSISNPSFCSAVAAMTRQWV